MGIFWACLKSILKVMHSETIDTFLTQGVLWKYWNIIMKGTSNVGIRPMVESLHSSNSSKRIPGGIQRTVFQRQYNRSGRNANASYMQQMTLWGSSRYSGVTRILEPLRHTYNVE